VIQLEQSQSIDAGCDVANPMAEKRCGWFRWTCEYYNRTDFSYLDILDLIRLSPDGTGLVSVAASAHGRYCRVKQNGRGTCGDTELS